MISIARSTLLTATLAAFPLAGVMAQSDPGKSTGPNSAAAGNYRVDAKNAETAMKSTAPGYMSTGELHGATGKPSEGQLRKTASP